MPKQKEPYINPEPTATKSQPSIFSRIKNWFKEKFEAFKDSFSSLNKPGSFMDRINSYTSGNKIEMSADREQATKRFDENPDRKIHVMTDEEISQKIDFDISEKGVLEKYYGATDNLSIPEDVKSIDSSAFKYCFNFESLSIPQNVEYISKSAFTKCVNLNEIHYAGTKEQWEKLMRNSPNCGLEDKTVIFSNEKERNNFEFSDKNADAKGSKVADYIAGKDFIMYTSDQDQNFKINENGVLTKYDGMANSIIAPEHITEIGKNAFSQNENITDFVTFNNIKTIGDCAFENCKNLETIIISKGVESIGDSAFVGCENLKEVYYTGTREQWEDLIKNSPNCGLEGKEIIFINEKEHNDFEFSAGSDDDQWGPSLDDVTGTTEIPEENLSINEHDVELSNDECL